MAKKIKALVKLQIPGGQANPAPPVGTALGPHGVNIGEFTKQFNEQTKDKQGVLFPVDMTIFEDRSFIFKIKTPPASYLILKAVGIEKGSGNTPKETAGEISKSQIEEIAKQKMEDLNAISIESAVKIIQGTARSMGIKVK